RIYAEGTLWQMRATSDHRYTPLWPSEYRPGWGNRARPCGLAPTWMMCRTLPVRVLITETEALNLFETQSWFPSAETCSMSGLPPTCQVAVTLRVAKLITEIVPARRLDT